MRAQQALRDALDRLLRHDDPALLISRVATAALEEMAAIIDSGGTSPLAGSTFTVKDNIDVVGTTTTAGCPSYGTVADQSAAVVQRLVAAGALPMAKTNLDQFATGLVGTRSPYGVPRNPYDASLIPGGSSSGSAVSVAEGLVDFALGTDTAGSGRVPAAMCGIVGLKPTRGWLSTRGVLPAVRSVDCVSLLARDVETAWAATNAAAGDDPLEPMSRRAPSTSRATSRKVGVVPAPVLAALGVDDDVAAGYANACDTLEIAGMRLSEIDMTPFFSIGDLLYGGPWVAERYAAVGEFLEGGHAGLDPVVLSIITAAKSLTAVQAMEAVVVLAGLRRQVDATFGEVDLLITPTVPTIPTIAAVQADPRGLNERLGRFTTFNNLADMCALTIPVGASPIGGRRPPPSVSLHGPAWSEEMLVAAARHLTPGTEPDTRTPRGWLTLAVAGAHLRGLRLERQFTDHGARWLCTTTTAPAYRLYALASTTPPMPGLARTADGTGAPIEIDLWALQPAAFGDFVRQLPSPLCVGVVELADGTATSGLLCEPGALEGAADVTSFGR